MCAQVTNRGRIQQLIKNLVEEGRTVEVPVYGYSMYPFLKPGVKVRIKRVEIAEVNKGDVALFVVKGTMILHRVLGKEDCRLVCRGDNMWRLDPLVDQACLCGVMTHWHEDGRWNDVDMFYAILFRFLALWLHPFVMPIYKVIVLFRIKF